MLRRTERSSGIDGTETFGGLVTEAKNQGIGMQVVVAVDFHDPTVRVPMIELRRHGSIWLAVSADDLRYLARCFDAAADYAERKEVTP